VAPTTLAAMKTAKHSAIAAGQPARARRQLPDGAHDLGREAGREGGRDDAREQEQHGEQPKVVRRDEHQPGRHRHIHHRDQHDRQAGQRELGLQAPEPEEPGHAHQRPAAEQRPEAGRH